MDADATSLPTHYARGVSLYSAGLYDQSARELDRLAGRDDLLGRLGAYYRGLCHRAMGLGALGSGQFDAALEHFKQAMSLVGRQADLGAYLAAIYARSGDLRRCEAEMLKQADGQGDQPGTQRRLALAHWQAGRRCEAMLTLQAALRRCDDPAMHRQMGFFHAAEGNWSAASEAFMSALAADGTSAESHYQLGLSYLAASEPAAALGCLQRALQLRPTDLLISYQLSLCAAAVSTGGYHATVSLPDSTPPVDLSHISQLASHVTSEAGFIDAMLDLPPSEADDDLLVLLLAVVQTALVEHPTYADLRYHCGRILQRMGRHGEAMEQVQAALTINGGYVKAMLLMADLLDKAGLDDQALQYVERAIARGADYADVHCQAGEMLGRLNQHDKARRHLSRALEINGKYERAARMMESLAA